VRGFVDLRPRQPARVPENERKEIEMAPNVKLTLRDAAIATNADLNQIADKYGVFATAEATTMGDWINSTRMSVAQQVAKTRNELKRLEQSLARLDALVASQFGRPSSTFPFEKEYAALEGWSLTLMANYIALVGLAAQSDQEKRFVRAIDYTRGAIQLAATPQPGRAMTFQKPVLDALRDQSVIYS
jgi:hypothetical protein